ncbi:hypothetical protein WxcX [Methyloglobulus morosus KoM1]|uniref:Uncharacterized protein n=1 Tax=Methyloglobulus morosus KoM1 TaxID=1116472 RepID=V5BUT7_9GAMM|nr:glycoside hydrolase family 99-like domain-containing protein [Methyloglobulus morosus]ESS71614.1 hypothetical protein WxcX [Methyloglobulus morosus KoM1]
MSINTLLDITSFSPKFQRFSKDKTAHLPFAAWVIRESSPKIFVELGTYRGDSYFSFCQSVDEASLLTQCYAIGAWQDDEHSREYSDEIFAAVHVHNEEYYAGFSQLLRMGNDDALAFFSDESIGLLHITGSQTYEAVSHSFKAWLPKLTADAVVMFRNIKADESSCGAGRFWKELQTHYPNNLEFVHSSGLGVFQLNDTPTDKKVTWLDPNSKEKQRLVNYFVVLDSRLNESYELGLLQAHIAESNEKIASLTQAVAERDLALAERDQIVAVEAGQIEFLKLTIKELYKEIKHITQSKSWKLTRPLRIIRRKWGNHPLDHGDGYCLPLQYFDDLKQSVGLTLSSAHSVQNNPEYVPLFKGKPFKSKPAKLICFYHPQFHTASGNAKLRGESCPEWSKVCSAEPQFVDHYQPHIPSELGYYNLIDPGVQRRQIELAKLYGIEGFCFYFHWRSGNSLLETPIQNYLKDDSLDLPFCLCWVNDYRSLQGDGLDSDVLIPQRHALDDAIAFIQHVSLYMRDPRYIRIDNKPLLLVKCPNLLPLTKETAGRWRQWCKDQGIGKIYLAYTQSLETGNPTDYGFDAAIEFPPIDMIQQNRADKVQPLGDNFACTVYDYNQYVDRSRSYGKPNYTLFRAICPSWDTTSLYNNKSTVLLGSSPLGYQEWLFNAISETFECFDNQDERLIFINAWNGWDEGAHLEPDQRYGYAYLEATRMALARKAAIASQQVLNDKNSVAVVIHAFYEDVFDEMLEYLKNIHSVYLKLYVTVPIELIESMQRKLQRQQHNFYALPVSNRGRDILPFIKIMPEVLKGGHDLLIKIHTKKSTHREDGDLWRKDIFEKLLSESAIRVNSNYLVKNRDIGILGPTEHIVPMNSYLGSNAVRVSQLAARMGVDSNTLEQLNFVAGSMFMARTKAIIPLMNMALSETDFEAEAKQVDGTLAHALERLFSVSACAAKLTTSCPDNLVTESYKFVNRQSV